ncbi:phosphoribosylanthranilate isomerase [Terriglobus saanensis]|uniref:N-(5'-phosphoribosyl)anthranilate isomerase n=1 Tax=Terriglobus saanensis (strain ATCC BAA-1853 / DSM 23119 / SP1PR4) TaxID=401053 RepID=E8V267_TERSS|nr:phosphoribosylanthranilate isomerase [Terriglobus saanensis]ADV84624.1 Phosphoribosylanthranilate isomerase [Terriglobus saanensis SP1PR4]
MWVKICANTNLADAHLAASLHADAVGFVFAPSTRQVTAVEVAAITPLLPAELDKIGVFHSQDAEEILSVVKEAALTGVQLHRSYVPGLVAELRRALPREEGRVRILQTVHWDIAASDSESASQLERFTKQIRQIAGDGMADAILVDSSTKSGSGGTGISFNWKRAAQAIAAAEIPIVVAGGLRPINVAEAVETLCPWGVDVASGVEAEPGIKDPEKVRLFIANAKATADEAHPGRESRCAAV